jgi:cell division protein ZapA
MTSKTISTTIEILGKIYPIRCEESELPSLQQAAALLDKKMAEIKESGKVINLERIAIISALNMAHQFLQLDQQKSSYLQTINLRITQLQAMLDASLNKAPETELIYSAE